MTKTIWEQKYQGKFPRDRDPWESLLAWTPEIEPAGFRMTYKGMQPKAAFDNDAKAPFFSETYLYNLLGKEDARTLLALLRQAMAAADIDMHEVETRVYAGAELD